MFDIYFDLPSWLRSILAVVVLATGITMTVLGYRNRPQYFKETQPDGQVLVVETGGGKAAGAAFRIGMIVAIVGAVLVVVSGKSRAEKQGYKF